MNEKVEKIEHSIIDATFIKNSNIYVEDLAQFLKTTQQAMDIIIKEYTNKSEINIRGKDV